MNAFLDYLSKLKGFTHFFILNIPHGFSGDYTRMFALSERDLNPCHWVT